MTGGRHHIALFGSGDAPVQIGRGTAVLHFDEMNALPVQRNQVQLAMTAAPVPVQHRLALGDQQFAGLLLAATSQHRILHRVHNNFTTVTPLPPRSMCSSWTLSTPGVARKSF